ncbi:MAG: alpha/beta hydrolase [Anaerolineae bacterium]|jgi:pimeloyl-ACP methyl ester carboxylesterase
MKGPYRTIGLLLILISVGIGAAGCGAAEPTAVPAAQVAASPTPPPSEMIATATSEPSTASPEHAGYVPVFEADGCKFPVPLGKKAKCGYLTVPQDRSQPDGPQVRLHVVIYKSENPNPAPDPVIHLVGGPGGNLLDSSAFYLRAGGDRILETRDYILFNQRGTHYAEPSLECPGNVAFGWELAEQHIDQEERDAREIEFLLDCQDSLLGQGINLAAYNSAENASDVNDLRIALGYEQVNLYGISYGTRLALTVMRDYPEGIRSVILDSVLPLQVGLYSELALNANRALVTLFGGCAADAACHAQHGNLEETFYQVVDELNAHPVTVRTENGTATAWVDGDVFMEIIFGSLYRVDAIPWIPVMIDQASQGDFGPIRYPLEVMFDRSGVSFGMYHTMQCREEVAFESYEDSLALAADLSSQVAERFASRFPFTVCESWKSGRADPVENEPVASDIPTLVLSGQYDPITPPAWGRLAAETLSKSFFYEFPGIGHGVMRSNQCGLDIGLQFLDDPTTEPDTSCLAQLTGPRFR